MLQMVQGTQARWPDCRSLLGAGRGHDRLAPWGGVGRHALPAPSSGLMLCCSMDFVTSPSDAIMSLIPTTTPQNPARRIPPSSCVYKSNFPNF